jgi:hypothetical protein
MIPFRDALGPDDREHLRRIARGGPDDKVADFLLRNTYVATSAREPFRRLSQADRERVISDLAWRVTCLIEGSVTQVEGVKAFELDAGFAAVKSEWKGEEILCLVKETGR